MKTPLVEMDGDEMTRIIWKMIKDELLLPYVDLNTEYYDLGLPERERTQDKVTFDSAYATQKYGVAVKCATITPNKQRVEEYNLSQMWKSPNGTIRAILDGTVFRHAYGDVYKATEYRVPCKGTATLSFKGENGEEFSKTIYDFECPGVIQGMYNKDSSIISFAHSCFKFAIDTKQDLWFSTKDTISKQYDQTFKLIFEDIYEKQYREKFEELGIKYFYTLIDDAVARVIRSEGGYIWACKNYDGDVMSDMVSTAFGSLAMMTSVLVSPDGKYEYEAAHGTVTRHYYRYLKGEETSTNPMATIFAWSGALRKRGELDSLPELVRFANLLEEACIDTLNRNIMTKDLSGLVSEGTEVTQVSTARFINEVKKALEAKLYL